MHKHLKIRSLILVTLIVASFFTVTFSPSTTLAVDNKKSPNENARALAYFYTLRRCVAETFSSRTSLTSEQIDNFSWLSGYKLPLGAQFISSNGDWDGNVNCDGGGEYGSWRQDAVRALGYSNNRELLCNMINPYQVLVDGDSSEASRSAVEAEYGNCVKGQGNLDVDRLVKSKDSTSLDKNSGGIVSSFNNSAGQDFFGDTSPISSTGVDLPLQQLFYATFEKFCQPTGYNGGTIGNDLRKVSIKKFDSVSSSYKSVDVLIKADRISKTTDVIAHNVLPSGEPNKTLDSSTMSCQQIIEKTNSHADKAQVVYDALPKETRDEIAPAINGGTRGGGDDSTDTSSCSIEGIGWILCPIMNFFGGITDASYGIVEQLLKTPPISTNLDTNTNPLYASWLIMQSIANVAFVIAFLIIIYSQLTGAAISNYGIKKMLPRLIVAAILVNISYWICAVAVDISNILGRSMKDLFDLMATRVVMPESSLLGGTISGGTFWADLTGMVLSGAIVGVTLLVYPAVLLPILVAAIAAIVTVVIVLTLRQALIIMLIVAAPLAFVAYLLPNTEGLFKKWLALFRTMLIMFPVIAAIFGISAFAGKIVMASANGNVLVQIMGAGVTIIPLFITPVIMKAAGGVLNRFAGVVNNPNKGVFDRMRKGAEGVKANSAFARGMRIRKQARQGYKDRTYAGQLAGTGRSKMLNKLTSARSAGLPGAIDSGVDAANKAADWVQGKAEGTPFEAAANTAALGVAAAGSVGSGQRRAEAEALRRAAQGAVAEAARKEVAEAKEVLKQSSTTANATASLLASHGSMSDVDIEAHVDFILSEGGEGDVRKIAKDQSLMSSHGEAVWKAVRRNDSSIRGKHKDIANFASQNSGNTSYDPATNTADAAHYKDTIEKMQAAQLIAADPDMLSQAANGTTGETYINSDQARLAEASDSFANAKIDTQAAIKKAALRP